MNDGVAGISMQLSNTKEFQFMKHVKKVSKLHPSKPAQAAVVIGEKAPKGEKKEPTGMVSL